MIEEKDISIIVPAFNESEAITPVLCGIIEKFPECEIIVVDDGSSDNTCAIIDGIDGIVAIHHLTNRGYGAALKTGIRASDRKYVLMCDADGQHRVEDIKRIIEAADGYDMVVGVRGTDSNAPLVRRPGKFILRHFANWLVGKKLPDFNSGLRIFRREVIARYMYLASDKFSFSTTSSFVMMKTGQRINYIPIKVERRLGKSSVRQLRHGVDTIMLMIRLTMLYDPLKVFCNIASIVGVFAVASVIYNVLFYQKIKLSMTSLLLLLATLLIFLFGLVCDQVSAIRRELHERD